MFERDGLDRERERQRMTGPCWMAVGPEAAVALSVYPVATALPGSELWAVLLQTLFFPTGSFMVKEIWVKRWNHPYT